MKAADEIEVLKELVEGVRDRKRLQGYLILTDRRLVMQVAKASSRLGMMFGGGGMLFEMFGGFMAGLLSPPSITHAIPREDFDRIEEQSRGVYVFHSKGDGYAHISFVVYSRTPFATWQRRMEQWVMGQFDEPSLPTAKVIDR